MITTCIRCGMEKLKSGQEPGKYEGEKTNFNYVFCPDCMYVETVLLESNLPNADMNNILKFSARDYRDRIAQEKRTQTTWCVNSELPPVGADMLFNDTKISLEKNLIDLKTELNVQ